MDFVIAYSLLVILPTALFMGAVHWRSLRWRVHDACLSFIAHVIQDTADYVSDNASECASDPMNAYVGYTPNVTLHTLYVGYLGFHFRFSVSEDTAWFIYSAMQEQAEYEDYYYDR